MAVYKQPKSKYWWYKFTWNGEQIRESTNQTNKRVAEQMEAAHRTALAKGEVGIREKKPVSTLKEFAERDFLPFVQSTFAAKAKTLAYYENGVNRLLAFERLARERLDAISSDRIAEYIAQRQAASGKRGRSLQVASLNRELQVLRRIFHLAQEWGRVERALPNVKMIRARTTANESSRRRKRRSTSEVRQQKPWNNTPTLACSAMLRRSCWIAVCAQRSASGFAPRMSPMASSKFISGKPRTPVAVFR